MKGLLTIVLLILRFSSFGQTCDTINGNHINCVDIFGQKQGYWELTKKNIIVSGYGGLGSKEGCCYFEQAEYYLLASGVFKDNKKIGVWKYYSGDKKAILERKTTYDVDGSFKDENLLYNYTLEINRDSLLKYGKLIIEHDTLNINCHMKTCSINLSNGQTLKNLSYSDITQLELELLKIQMGEYSREIEKLKRISN